MSDENYGCISIFIFILIVWWATSHHNEKIREESYSTGYDDGYDNGQADISREDITAEEVSSSPETYCKAYVNSKLEELNAYIIDTYICYKK